MKLNNLYVLLNETVLSNLWKMAQMLALFGLAYWYEQIFSIMNINRAYCS